MNATPSVAAPSVPGTAAASNAGTGANATPAESSDVGDFAAMLEALSVPPAALPVPAADADLDPEGAAEEAAGSAPAGDAGGLAALAGAWPWLGLPGAAPAVAALPPRGASAMPPERASSAEEASALQGRGGRPGAPRLTAQADVEFQAAQGPDLAPRGRSLPAAAGEAALPAAFAPSLDAARAEAPASLTDAASALAPNGAAVAPAVSATTHVPAPVHQAALASRPGEPAFAADLAAEVRVMVEGGLQEAELSLHPAELGPIQVQLRVHGGSADISLAAANGFTRDGLAQALPELREMLASQGLQLGQAGVDAGRDGRGFADAPPRQGQGQGRGGHAGSGPTREDAAPAPMRRAAVRTLLDLYA